MLVDEVFERDDTGLRRYAVSTRKPLEPLFDYTEVVVDKSSVYISFLEKAVPGAAGKWVRAEATDTKYIEELVSPDPSSGGLFEYLEHYLGTEASPEAWLVRGPALLSGPRDSFKVREDTTWSRPGRCAYVISYDDSEELVRVTLDAEGRVVQADSTLGIEAGESYWITVSYDPVPLTAPGAEKIVPDAVGREYVIGKWAAQLISTGEYFAKQLAENGGVESTQRYFDLLAEAGPEYHAGIADGWVTQTLRGVGGQPRVVRENGRIVSGMEELDPVLQQIELSYEGAVVCVSVNRKDAPTSTVGHCSW